MHTTKSIKLMLVGIFSLALASCGGGGGYGTTPEPTHTITGNITGLGTGVSVTLLNNGADSLTLTSNSVFSFNTAIAHNGSYAVTVSVQPAGQICSVSNATGTGITSNVMNVQVTCSTNSYTIGGSVSGLSGQLSLLNNGTNSTVISTNGGFTFSSPLAYGTTYAVTASRQPTGQTCSISNGTGSGLSSNVSNVQVVCTASALTVSSLAGSGAPGFANGTGSAAVFSEPDGIAVDSQGNVYVADCGNSRIRQVTPAGVVSTFAGSGVVGHTDNAAKLNATFGCPNAVAIDSNGVLYVSDYDTGVRKILTDGSVTTLASGPDVMGGKGLAVDSAGNVYLAQASMARISKITPNGTVSVVAGSTASPSVAGYQDGTGTSARFDGPSAIAVDNAGNLFVADTNNHRIRKITSSGVVSTFAGSGANDMTDATGTSASFGFPTGVAIDTAGTLFVVDTNGLVRKVTATAEVTTYAGNKSSWGNADGPVASASFGRLSGVAVSASGTVYVSDLGNYKIRKIAAP